MKYKILEQCLYIDERTFRLQDKNGEKFIVDIFTEEKYCEIARQRLRQQTLL